MAWRARTRRTMRTTMATKSTALPTAIATHTQRATWLLRTENAGTADPEDVPQPPTG